MLRTVFHIPGEVGGISTFGFGWLLAAWVASSVVLLAWLTYQQGFNADTRGWLPILLMVAAGIAWLMPSLVDKQGLPIRGFGSMMLAAAVAAVALAAWRAKRMGIDPDSLLSLAFVMFIAGIVGARLFYVVEYWDDFRAATLGGKIAELLNVAQGGLVFYGSVIGAVAAFLTFAWFYRLPALAVGDVIAPSVALGLAIGRIGCFLNGCCYGGVSDVPWAVAFPQGSPPHERQVRDGTIFLHGLKFQEPRDGPAIVAKVEPGSAAEAAGIAAGDRIWRINERDIDRVFRAQFALLSLSGEGEKIEIAVRGDPQPHTWRIESDQSSVPVQPTQLYSTISGLLLCLVLLAYTPMRRHDGEVLALLATLYPVIRFLLEMIRSDEPGVWITGMTISQNISLIILVGAAALWAYILSRPKGTVLPGPTTLAVH